MGKQRGVDSVLRLMCEQKEVGRHGDELEGAVHAVEVLRSVGLGLEHTKVR